ncbi:MAG: hypothetical protein H6855_02895 [Rhodospirillales bacterium]|nr:hypothetical protein [Rhodospirillales bacterium]
MYYILTTTDPWDGYIPRVEYRDDDPFRFWNIGEHFEEDPPTPLRARVLTDSKTILPDMWQTPLPMMSLQLYDVLRDLGISALDTYPVELTDSRTGDAIEGYVAFNLTSAVAAVNSEKSRRAPDPDNTGLSWYDYLELDPQKAQNAHMFILAESVGTIIVDQMVRDRLEAENFPTLSFYEPKDWVGA